MILEVNHTLQDGPQENLHQSMGGKTGSHPRLQQFDSRDEFSGFTRDVTHRFEGINHSFSVKFGANLCEQPHDRMRPVERGRLS